MEAKQKKKGRPWEKIGPRSSSHLEVENREWGEISLTTKKYGENHTCRGGLTNSSGMKVTQKRFKGPREEVCGIKVR